MARPTYKPTTVTRQKVAVAAGAGMAHEQIAIGLGISRNTLEKHFEKELSVGAYGKRMEVLLSLHQAAKKGSSSAAKAYLAAEPWLAAPPVPAQPDVPQVPVAKPAQKLGKKEQAKIDASTAAHGTGWEGLLPGSAQIQ